jgi:hypothetical protein
VDRIDEGVRVTIQLVHPTCGQEIARLREPSLERRRQQNATSPKLAAELHAKASTESTMSTKPQAHATKWTVVVGLDRPTVRLFADQAKAETERDFHVQHGRQAYLLPPIAGSGGTQSAADGTFAHLRNRLKALHGCVGLLAIEMDPQEVYAGMVDAAGILEELAKDMREAGLAKDEKLSDPPD